MDLLHTEHAFQDGLLGRSQDIEAHVRGNARENAATMFGVYRSAYWARLVECLGNDFPALKLLAGDEVFVRSWRGTKGRWYRDLAASGPANLEFDGHRLTVQAIPTNDAETIARVSEEFLRKYRTSSHGQEMVRPETWPTTLRLEPRENGNLAI